MSYDLGGFSVTASTSRVMLIIFAVYSVVIVGFGFYIKYQSKKGGKDGLASFLTGGGGLGAFAIAMIAATNSMAGGTMVAAVASQIMSEILPLLGVEPDYTAEELVGADTTVPNVVGQTREAAEDRLADLGFTFRTVGDGDTVTDQTPAGGAIVPGNASIILYLGQEKPDTPCTVPNVVGKSASEANKAITNAGLIMKVTGTTTASSGNVYAITQSLPAGTEVAAGTVVTVQFGDNSVLD